MAKLNKRIKQQASKRAKRPRPQPQLRTPLQASNAEQRRMVKQHQSVLFAIESTLFGAAQQAPGIDDQIIERALRAAIRNEQPEGEEAAALAAKLAAVRQAKMIDEETWHLGLRVVYKSVRTHSECEPGDHHYLSFVGQFLRG